MSAQCQAGELIVLTRHAALKRRPSADEPDGAAQACGSKLVVVEVIPGWMCVQPVGNPTLGWLTLGGGNYAPFIEPAADAEDRPAESSSFTIKVMHPEHPDLQVATLEVRPSSKIADIKAEICEKTGFRPAALVPVKKYVIDSAAVAQDPRFSLYSNWVPVDLATDTAESVGLVGGGGVFHYSYIGLAETDLKPELRFVKPHNESDSDSEGLYDWSPTKKKSAHFARPIATA